MFRNNTEQQGKMIRLVLLLLCAALLFGVSGWNQASAAAKYTMKVGHATANDGQDAVTKFFAKEVERLSEGKIKAPVYNASQLGNNPKMNKDVRSGAQEVLVQPAGFSVPYIPTLGVLDLPFLFNDLEVQTKVLNSKATTLLHNAAQKVGLEIVMWYAGGFKYIATKFPLTTADGLKGRKVRVIQSPELVAQFKAFGAVGVPMPLGECYTALQQGVVEGISTPIDVIEKFKFHRVTGHVSSTRHGTLSSIILVNSRWLSSLPADLQKTVREAGRTTAMAALGIMNKFQTKSLETVKKEATYIEFPEQERAKLKKISEQVWDQMRQNKAKAEVMDILLDAMKAYK